MSELSAISGRVLIVDDTAFNRRLLGRLLRTIGHEPFEASDGQAATNEVLAIMSRSAFELQTVLEAVVGAARRLCQADYGAAYVAEDGAFRVVASSGGSPELDAYERSHPITPGRGSVVGRVALT